MKLIVDECLAESTKGILNELGFELLEVEEILNKRATDEEIYEYAKENAIAIITHDRGFGEIYYKASESPPLTKIVEMLPPHPEATNDLISRSFQEIKLKDSKYKGKLIIVTSSAIRIRPKQ
ncbi:MAG: DUF5615 family PIN-like protein [Candidatus Heimdallarchaeota archaeon]|nr:DUF5615 family PIN-like protein [Candidatus Heimdallarchaeota archaeon]